MAVTGSGSVDECGGLSLSTIIYRVGQKTGLFCTRIFKYNDMQYSSLTLYKKTKQFDI